MAIRSSSSIASEYYKLKSEGLMDAEIAQKWGWSRSKLTRIKGEQGIKYGKKVSRVAFNMDQNEYLRLKEKGMKDIEIAMEHFISLATLQRWKYRSDFYRNRNSGIRAHASISKD